MSDPRVADLARAIYASYSRFALELIRLPGLPADEPLRLMRREGPGHEAFIALWERCRAEGRGIIVVSGHIGSIEIFAGAYAREASRPTAWRTTRPSRSCSSCSTPRARWGVTIIPWRDLRDIFRVMRSPVVLGMVVDWGYRTDDLPVRLFGAWTTLPAGPATLAARTGAVIVPVAARRERDGRYHPAMSTPIEVAGRLAGHAGRRDPGDRRRARGDGARSTRAVAHVQADVAGHSGGVGRPGGTRAWAHRAGMTATSGEPSPTVADGSPSGCSISVSRMARRLPDRPVYGAAFRVGACSSPGRCPSGEPSCAPTSRGSAAGSTRTTWRVPRCSDATHDRRRMDALVRAAFGHWVVTYVESALAPRYDADELRERITALDPEAAARSLERPGPGGVGSIQLAMHFGSVDLAALVCDTRRRSPP